MIDLAKLPPPAVIEVLDFEALVTAHKQDLLQRHPSTANVLALPSEPLVKQVEAFAYREMLLRGRVNDAARANLLAFATGTDLDHKGAFYNLARMPAKQTSVIAYVSSCALPPWLEMAPQSNTT